MKRYFFHLKKGHETIIDPRGETFASKQDAYDHGVAVIQELMRYRELASRSWQLEICDEDRCVQCRLLFASYDPALEKVPPQVRRTVEIVSHSRASLSDTIAALNRSLLEVKATLARANNMPFLATYEGQRVEQ
ncbi:MAG: hypothetical protein JOZ70_05695 [Pseudolabrys sp.]|nr:hypothetical protein [Pseudolabrys sp.]MBV9954722.1 hypothetical protein [Pseudolabrys sp.]